MTSTLSISYVQLTFYQNQTIMSDKKNIFVFFKKNNEISISFQKNIPNYYDETVFLLQYNKSLLIKQLQLQ